MTTITLSSGRQIAIGTGVTYTNIGGTSSHVYTNEQHHSGVVMAGPTVTKADWKRIAKAQRLSKQWCEADSKATGYYKQSRYWIVNHCASDARIEQAIDRMNRWEAKRDAIDAALSALEAAK